MGREFPGVNFPGEMLHWGDLAGLLYEILFNVLHSLCQILYVEMFPGLFSTCFDFREILFTEGGISGVIEKSIRY